MRPTTSAVSDGGGSSDGESKARPPAFGFYGLGRNPRLRQKALVRKTAQTHSVIEGRRRSVTDRRMKSFNDEGLRKLFVFRALKIQTKIARKRSDSPDHSSVVGSESAQSDGVSRTGAVSWYNKRGHEPLSLTVDLLPSANRGHSTSAQRVKSIKSSREWTASSSQAKGRGQLLMMGTVTRMLNHSQTSVGENLSNPEPSFSDQCLLARMGQI